jgi:hypothetical protein
MRSIYEHADQALIWLGEGDTSMNLAMDAISAIAASSRRIQVFTLCSSLQELGSF